MGGGAGAVLKGMGALLQAANVTGRRQGRVEARLGGGDQGGTRGRGQAGGDWGVLGGGAGVVLKGLGPLLQAANVAGRKQGHGQGWWGQG